jgi:PadR family transcriptional regulator
MLVSNKALSFGAVSILHAVASGSRFGFDVMEATGLTSGTVYPTLDRLEHQGLLRSRWEDEAAAHAEGRPARRYFHLTAAGVTALETALRKYRTLRPIDLRRIRPEPSER